MRNIFIVVALAVLLAAPGAAAEGPEAEVRRIIKEFQEGSAAHDISKLEPLMAEDMVAFENGGRNDGWKDFRDNHLIPEFEGPAAPMEWEFVRVVATPEMGWGYTKSTFTVMRRNGEEIELLLWSIYVLEKRDGNWKITVLDWSLKVPRRRAG